MRFLDNYIFWVVQGCALLAVIITYVRTQKTDRLQFNLYHSYLCIPLMAQYFLLDAWFMFSLCLIGSIRTLFLATNWGWDRRKSVVAICLVIPVLGSVYTATHWVDWFLVVGTIVGVGSEALKSFTQLRIASVLCAVAWMMNNLVFGGYVTAMANLASIIGHTQKLNQELSLTLRMWAFLGCQKSKLAYLRIHDIAYD